MSINIFTLLSSLPLSPIHYCLFWNNSIKKRIRPFSRSPNYRPWRKICRESRGLPGRLETEEPATSQGLNNQDELPFHLYYRIFCRAHDETISDRTTRAMMDSRIAAVSPYSRVSVLRFRNHPMPPAPKKPRTVAARKLESQL